MVVQMSALPVAGETVLGGEFLMAAGGKGANQAVAAARLGAVVAFVARVGNDMFGRQALGNFQEDGILTENVVKDLEHPTGVALIMVDGSGENIIAVASGANSALCKEDVRAAQALIEESSVVLLQLEVPLETVRFAAELAAASGAKVILNPAPAQVLDSDLLKSVSILTPNETEAARLTGIVPEDTESSDAVARKLRGQGVDSVVITLGESGAYLSTEGYSGLIPVERVIAQDTTAAGDAFNGALAFAISRGAELPEAVRFANHVGALSVTKVGAQPSLPTMAQVEARFPETRSIIP
jgi:ribokinase